MVNVVDLGITTVEIGEIWIDGPHPNIYIAHYAIFAELGWIINHT